MNPQEQYTALIHNRAINPLPPDVYGEIHHIYPKCLGGNDEPENLIKLTLQEHYKAHYLLPFIYTEGKAHAKLLYAWNQMKGRMPTGDIDKDADEYARLREEFRRYRIEQNKAGLSPESRKKISESMKNHTGWHHSPETRRKISEAQRGRKAVRPAWNKGKKTGLSSERQKEAVRAANIRRWSNPEARKHHSELLKQYYKRKHQNEQCQ